MFNWIEKIERLEFKTGSNLPILINDLEQRLQKLSTKLSPNKPENFVYWSVFTFCYIHYNKITPTTINTISNFMKLAVSSKEGSFLKKRFSFYEISNSTVYNLLNVYNQNEREVTDFINSILQNHFEPSNDMKKNNPILSFLDAKLTGKRKTITARDMEFTGFADSRKREPRVYKKGKKKREIDF